MFLFGSLLPRVSEELKNIFHLSLETRIADSYLFEKHIVIRVYGFEEEPFLLPTFLKPSISSLEYIKHSFALHI